VLCESNCQKFRPKRSQFSCWRSSDGRQPQQRLRRVLSRTGIHHSVAATARLVCRYVRNQARQISTHDSIPLSLVRYTDRAGSHSEASTFGLAYITAALGVFKNRPLPTPWNPAPRDAKHPIVVYGASSAVGAFAVKLASLANLHPIIAIAGQSGDVVKSILDPKKGDMFLDYRQGPEKLIQRIRSTPEDNHFAFDAICGEGTSELLCQVLHPENSYLGRSLRLEEGVTKIPQNIDCQVAFAPGLWEPNDPDGPDGENSPNVGPRAFATVAFAYLTFALENELIQGHPYEVLPNGLEGLSDALKAVKAGKNKGVKYVCEIAATPGFSDVL
jgi:NADPH2:quinone reductase